MTREQTIDMAVRETFARYADFMLGDMRQRLEDYPHWGRLPFDNERLAEIRTRFNNIEGINIAVGIAASRF